MARNSNKTPLEIANELQAKADRAKIRAVQAEAETNPTLLILKTRIEEINKQLAEISRKLNGPNSFDFRLHSLELRRDWVLAERDYINALHAELKREKASLMDHQGWIAQRIAQGENPTENEARHIVDNVQMDQDQPVGSLKLAAYDAESKWREFTKKAKGDDATMEAS